jgi:hypothetical protein
MPDVADTPVARLAEYDRRPQKVKAIGARSAGCMDAVHLSGSMCVERLGNMAGHPVLIR